MTRTTNTQFLIDVAMSASRRSTCPRLQVGAVIIDPEKRILSTGYNGAARGLPHCTDAGCLIEPETGRCKRTVHAEVNAILNARQSLIGCSMICTHHPCPECLPIIHNAGIMSVGFIYPYVLGQQCEIAEFMDIYQISTEG